MDNMDNIDNKTIEWNDLSILEENYLYKYVDSYICLFLNNNYLKKCCCLIFSS